jgi:heat shock protein HslJ
MQLAVWTAAGCGSRAAGPPPAPPPSAGAPEGVPGLAAIAGMDWILTAWSDQEPAAAEPRVTLRVSGGGFAGRAACNSYFSAVRPGDAPDTIALGPIGTTRMACPAPVMAVERRYLELLARVTRFTVEPDRVTLVYGGESGGAMGFEPGQ